MFGGMTISLILPKLIRSVTRDGIFIFLSVARQQRRTGNYYLTTQGKPVAFSDKLATPTTDV
jgi:hypothetical protein